jgi:hypothetical protein
MQRKSKRFVDFNKGQYKNIMKTFQEFISEANKKEKEYASTKTYVDGKWTNPATKIVLNRKIYLPILRKFGSEQKVRDAGKAKNVVIFVTTGGWELDITGKPKDIISLLKDDFGFDNASQFVQDHGQHWESKSYGFEPEYPFTDRWPKTI